MKKTLLYLLFLIMSSALYAGPSLFDLLTRDTDASPHLALFQIKNPQEVKIAKIRLHFLTAHDCYSGYIGFYENPEALEPFLAAKELHFALSAKAAYAAASYVTQDKLDINSIHSVLIRLISDKRQLGWFSGTCNDQDVNCCIPIECSSETNICTQTHDLGVQPIIWR